MNWRPRLLPAWSKALYTVEGLVSMWVEIADGPKIWAEAAVIDRPQKGKLLVSNKLLSQLNVRLVTPAMAKRQHRPACAELTYAIKEPMKTDDDETEPVHIVQRPVTDEEAAARAEAATVHGQAGVALCKMRVKLGLPAD
ncbi:hypothetical protein GGF42_001301 [Coemansia sp. RSA 2424]|nr:hypothetical protein GGF42_001301 [Coemansia sp. RSA 2424]